MNSGLKTLMIVAAMATTALPAAGLERDRETQEAVFATCAGRFSAEMEHDWLIGGTGDAARATRAIFVALIDAASDPAQAAALLDTRIRAKHAQAVLLQQASFHTDRVLARRAQAMAQRQRRLCETMILG